MNSRDHSEAQVVVNYGRNMLIENENGLIPAVLRGRKLKPVCGDYVNFSTTTDNESVIESLLPRRTELRRHDPRQGSRLLAANIDVLMVVMAARPEPDLSLVDRYLVAGEALQLDIELVFNKTDLLSDDEKHAWQARLSPYTEMGYGIHWASTKSSPGTDSLASSLKKRCGIFVGPSGAGKSSMIRKLVPDHEPRTQALSQASGQGQHTTTATRLYRLPEHNGGSIIDSPGVRDFRLWNIPVMELAGHFRDLRPFLDKCRFANCRHLKEPGCAIRQAVDSGEIHPRRYESYCMLAEVMQQQCEQH